jgi:hypothetical protein
MNEHLDHEVACYVAEHDWQSTLSVNYRNGIITKDVCRHCGVIRITTTWDDEPDFRSVAYLEADPQPATTTPLHRSRQ